MNGIVWAGDNVAVPSEEVLVRIGWRTLVWQRQSKAEYRCLYGGREWTVARGQLYEAVGKEYLFVCAADDWIITSREVLSQKVRLFEAVQIQTDSYEAIVYLNSGHIVTWKLEARAAYCNFSDTERWCFSGGKLFRNGLTEPENTDILFNDLTEATVWLMQHKYKDAQ